MRRVLRYLRIVFSAFCGVACVLLVVLWVRSYWRSDVIWCQYSASHAAVCGSRHGSLWAFRIAVAAVGLAWEMEGTETASEDDFWADIEQAHEYRGIFGFGIFETRRYRQLWAPYWFPILLFIALAAAPWTRWSRRFSLRTLLIATTLVAVLLGLTVYGAGK